jgi:hypothetical protein
MGQGTPAHLRSRPTKMHTPACDSCPGPIVAILNAFCIRLQLTLGKGQTMVLQTIAQVASAVPDARWQQISHHLGAICGHGVRLRVVDTH